MPEIVNISCFPLLFIHFNSNVVNTICILNVLTWFQLFISGRKIAHNRRGKKKQQTVLYAMAMRRMCPYTINQLNRLPNEPTPALPNCPRCPGNIGPSAGRPLATHSLRKRVHMLLRDVRSFAHTLLARVCYAQYTSGQLFQFELMTRPNREL